MQPFTRLSAIACPLRLANVDTDQLIPARFMKRSRADGYGSFLLHDLRFDEHGSPRPGFALSDPRCANAQIIVAERNFGTGSSREAAVYALWDYGVRCVIAPSFGDIFASNAVKNGLLPAMLGEKEVEALLGILSEHNTPVHVDLEAQRIRCGDVTFGFSIDPVRRLQLLNGWDDLDLTARHSAEIAAYRERIAREQAWRFPAGHGA